MEEEESVTVISGDVENIVIKLEPSENFLNVGDSLEFESIKPENCEESENTVFYGGFGPDEIFLSGCEENESNIIQTPFYLESYFRDNDCSIFDQQIDMSYLICEDCHIVFPNENLLQEHLVMHINIHKMGCTMCDQDLNMAEKFQLHVMAITRQSIYYCDLCRKSCAGVVRSKDQARPTGKTYACHDCEVRVKEQQTVSNISLPVTQNLCKIENCILHLGSSTGINILQVHKEKHSEMICNACEHCTNNFSLDPVLQSSKIKDDNFKIECRINDSKMNPDNYFHRCQYCEAFFAKSFTLTRHLRERHNHNKNRKVSQQCSKLKTNNKPEVHSFSCKSCKIVFPEDCMLKKHLKEKHKSNNLGTVKPSVETKISAKFKCSYCNVSYSENLNLTKHLREKHKIFKQKFICKLCLREFSLQRCYNNHMNFHEIAKNHVCFACKLAFLSKYELQQHVKIHNEEQQETECKKCEKNTLTENNQKRSSRQNRLGKP